MAQAPLDATTLVNATADSVGCSRMHCRSALRISFVWSPALRGELHCAGRLPESNVSKYRVNIEYAPTVANAHRRKGLSVSTDDIGNILVNVKKVM